MSPDLHDLEPSAGAARTGRMGMRSRSLDPEAPSSASRGRTFRWVGSSTGKLCLKDDADVDADLTCAPLQVGVESSAGGDELFCDLRNSCATPGAIVADQDQT